MDRCACLIFGDHLHYLDHLAPLAHLLNIPLIVSDPKIAALAKTYYPMVELVLCEDAEAIVQNYDTLCRLHSARPFRSRLFPPPAAPEKKSRHHLVPARQFGQGAVFPGFLWKD